MHGEPSEQGFLHATHMGRVDASLLVFAVSVIRLIAIVSDWTPSANLLTDRDSPPWRSHRFSLMTETKIVENRHRAFPLLEISAMQSTEVS